MFDRNDNKIWIVVAILAIGICFELLKHLPTEEKLEDMAEPVRLSETQPYSVHVEPAKHPKFMPMPMPMPALPKAVHVASDNAVLQQQLKEYVAQNEIKKTNSDKDKKKKKKKKKDDDEYEEVIDPVTGQKVRRKKKKADSTQAQDPSAGFVPPAPSEDPNAAAGQDPNANIAGAVAAAADGNEPPLSSAARTTNNLNSLQDWERLLLQQPNLTETQLFIKDYETHLVTAEVFYEIVHLMITDPRADIEQLGVLCAGDTPSAQSFGVLAAVDKAQPAGSAVKTNADKFISSGYSSASALPYLQTELGASDPHTQTLAVEQVDVVVKGLMGGALSSANSAELKTILPLVQQLANSSNAALSQQAQQTLSDLQTFIAESGGGTSSVT